MAELDLVRQLHLPEHKGRSWLAYVDEHGKWIASLSWNPGSYHPRWPVMGTVDAIGVDERYRRRGVATALWREVLAIEPTLHQADPSEWSADGAAWIAAVGGPILHHETNDPDEVAPRPSRRKPRRITRSRD